MGHGAFEGRWQRAKRRADIEGYAFHGLRYTAAGNLAEAGCSTKEIAAITGHQSLAMLQKYTRYADQKRFASSAIEKLEANRTKTETAKGLQKVEVRD